MCLGHIYLNLAINLTVKYSETIRGTCAKFARELIVPTCTLDNINVVKELHVFSACERLSLHSYICVERNIVPRKLWYCNVWYNIVN